MYYSIAKLVLEPKDLVMYPVFPGYTLDPDQYEVATED